MFRGNSNLGKKPGGNGLVSVSIDKVNKRSQYALIWAVDNLLSKGQTIILIHVVTNKSSSSYSSSSGNGVNDFGGAISAHKEQIKDIFLTFHCYCTRKDIQCFDVILEHSDVAKALAEYVSSSGIENLVLGASKNGFMRRLRMFDTPTNIMKAAPDFCTVYVISKTKISSVRNASRPAPFASPLLSQIHSMQVPSNSTGSSPDLRLKPSFKQRGTPRGLSNRNDSFRSPLVKEKCLSRRLFGDPPPDSDADISFVSSDRPSTDIMSSMYGESIDSGRTSILSSSSESSFESMRFGTKASDVSSMGFSSSSVDNEEVESEMRRLKLELQKTLEMYSTACKEAISAQQKASELQRWRLEEEKRLKEAKQSEEGELEAIEKEQVEHKETFEHAEAVHRISELESQKRIDLEMKILREVAEKQNAMSSRNGLMYRRYPIDEIEKATEYFAESRKVGEGGYGPVFRCYLDHTPVAVKVLRSDAAQGRSQYQKEVEVLSCLRHPNLVLLLGACPEYGCLVYEYMANGSLEDRLLQRGDTPALSWQLRFRIAAEVATGLHFLHQSKPEPLVHRDLKPANILLDHNFASKISDVGLARLVPPSIADDVTQCYMTSAAGTLCYIDPEYQKTGMLGVKSDIYSLGIVFLQLITGKPAKSLSHYVGQSIENGTFSEMLDPAVPDWPIEDAMSFAKLALQCAELKRKDRPDLSKVVLPELNRLRELANKSLCGFPFGVGATACPSTNDSNASMTQGAPSDEQIHSEEHGSKSSPGPSLPTEEAPDSILVKITVPSTSSLLTPIFSSWYLL
ncbi:hypothetical protein Leryth_010971 [Lithospermum erythrorhizon]|uniref:RING-type E3 ubiquitin transferase n=1 Tax=Lithospermum erythrorhizon TaxID=34254 RepID=A0AAV3PY08_LITER|nr:hypothetical protein Leryth_010971 [Lithospermum erythrorhizon]